MGVWKQEHIDQIHLQFCKNILVLEQAHQMLWCMKDYGVTDYNKNVVLLEQTCG